MRYSYTMTFFGFAEHSSMTSCLIVSLTAKVTYALLTTTFKRTENAHLSGRDFSRRAHEISPIITGTNLAPVKMLDTPKGTGWVVPIETITDGLSSMARQNFRKKDNTDVAKLLEGKLRKKTPSHVKNWKRVPSPTSMYLWALFRQIMRRIGPVPGSSEVRKKSQLHG